MDLEKLVEFICEAREKCSYETVGETGEQTLEDGTKIIGPYEKEEYSYVDKYKGFEYFVGIEEVFIDDEKIWERKYRGGINSELVNDRGKEEEIYAFLKEAMKQYPKKEPFKRGPKKFLNEKFKGYEYIDECDGNIEDYTGREIIKLDDEIVHEIEYSGGII